MIEFRDVSYLYGERTPFEVAAVKHLSFCIPEGKVTGMIGHTGSGKSTVAQLMNALIKPKEGQILLDGKDIWAKDADHLSIRFRVGLVFQYPEYQLFEETIERDIAFGPRNMGLTEEEIAKRIQDAARFTGLSDEMLKKSPFDLSGGQKRRAAIAGVIAMDPDVLVLDEPAAGLDPRGREEILGGLIEYRKERGNTLIIISHSMEDIAEYSDYIIALSKGELLTSGTPEDVFSQSGSLLASGLAIPAVTQVLHSLKQSFPELKEGFYTVEDAAAEILRVYRNRQIH